MHKLKIAILAAQIVFGTLDARITRQNISHGAIELNPMVRPVAHSNTIYFDFAAESAAQYFIGRKLEKSHPKISKFFFGAQVADLEEHIRCYKFSKDHSVTK